MSTLARCFAISWLGPLTAAAQEPIRELSLDVIEDLGREIYRLDQAASVATDILFAQRLELDDYPVRGWVVTGGGSSPLVTFVGEYDGEYKAVFDVRPAETGERRFELAQERELSREESAQFRARQTAQGAVAEPCAETYNSIVLRDPENDGWIVYWLAATTEPGVMVLGGHYRVMVSANGAEVVSSDRLSRSCMNFLQDQSQDRESVAAVVTHLVSSTPVETHIFQSLLHGKPIYVMTDDQTVWLVEGDRILKVETPQPQ